MSDNLVGYRNKVGETFSFVITGKTGRYVWGTDIYTDDSDLAVAAVHAGVVRNGETKTINVEILSGQLRYQGSSQNGITSKSYGAWAGSYSFIDVANISRRIVPNLRTYRRSVDQTFSFVITGSVAGFVWGTDIYTDDSDLTVAAVHAGVVSDGETKTVVVKILPGQTTYQGTSQNNIVSLSYGIWKGSYSFVTTTINPDTYLFDVAPNEMDTSVASTNDYAALYTDFSLFNARTTPISSLYTFTYPDSPGPMAGSSDDHDYLLLFYALPSKSLVFFDGNICTSITMIKDVVYDICWSRTTKVFLVATLQYLYEFQPLNSVLSEPYEFSKSSQTLWTITCDSIDLFIVHAPDMLMHRRNVKQPFAKKQEWTGNEIMSEQGDQVVGSIRIDERQRILAITIKQADHRWRLDLFLTDSMQRLQRSVPFGASGLDDKWYCIVTPLLNDYKQWLVVNDTIGLMSQLILLDEHAQEIAQLSSDASNVTLVGRDKIAFLNDLGVIVYRR